MTIEELENKLNAAYEVENQAQKVACNTMNKFIREYISTTTSNEIVFDIDDSVEYHVVDAVLPYYHASKLTFTYNDQNYNVTVTSDRGEEHPLNDTDINYNTVSDIILCKLYDAGSI